MSHTFNVRVAQQTDLPAIRDLNTRAFGRPAEAQIIDRMAADGDMLLQAVAESDGAVIGHIAFYAIGVFGRLGAVGLGPMCVDPWVQREGVGKALVHFGLQTLRDNGVSLVFVLGHPEYYPKFGFNSEATEPFEAPWKGPHFMALRLRYGPPMSGRLIFPPAFATTTPEPGAPGAGPHSAGA